MPFISTDKFTENYPINKHFTPRRRGAEYQNDLLPLWDINGSGRLLAVRVAY